MKESDFNNAIWKNILLDKVSIKLNFLAANVLLSRLKLRLGTNYSELELDKARREIFDLYLKFKELPNVQKDISILLGK